MSFGYRRWEDALLAQMWLREWSRTEFGLRYLEAFFKDMNTQHNPKAQIDPRHGMALQIVMLDEGDPTYVSADVCDIVDHAHKTFDPEPVLPGDPWTPNGFCLLAKPLHLPDAPPTERNPYRSATGTIPIRAIAWTSVHNEDLSVGCFWIGYYVLIEDEVREAAEQGKPHRWGNVLEDGMRTMPLSLVHQFQWTWGKAPWKEGLLDIIPGEDEKLTAERGKLQSALIQTLWRIGQQFVPSRQRLPRGIRRDAARRGLPREDVQVIALRRTRHKDDGDGESSRTLTVRHIVRGHWRNQYYASIKAHRQIWISPYVKGPDDAPFKPPVQRAWEFRR